MNIRFDGDEIAFHHLLVERVVSASAVSKVDIVIKDSFYRAKFVHVDGTEEFRLHHYKYEEFKMFLSALFERYPAIEKGVGTRDFMFERPRFW
jgi:hypothetical protein